MRAHVRANMQLACQSRLCSVIENMHKSALTHVEAYMRAKYCLMLLHTCMQCEGFNGQQCAQFFFRRRASTCVDARSESVLTTKLKLALRIELHCPTVRGDTDRLDWLIVLPELATGTPLAPSVYFLPFSYFLKWKINCMRIETSRVWSQKSNPNFLSVHFWCFLSGLNHSWVICCQKPALGHQWVTRS